MVDVSAKQKKAYLLAISTVLLWSTIASAFKLSLRYLDIWQLLFISTLTASLCLFVIVLIQGKIKLLALLKTQQYLRLLGFGLLNPFCYYLILFKAYELLPAQVAQALNYTWAITLMLLSIPILKHKISRFDLLATLICYSGVIVICFGGNQFPSGDLSIPGIALALASTLIWAIYWLFKARDDIDPVLGLFVSFCFSLPFVSIACLLLSDIQIHNTAGVIGGVYIGLFEMGITYVMWLLALKDTSSAAKISTLIFLSPILSLFIINQLLDEAIATTTIIGLCLIITGLLVQRKKTGTETA
ncbi:MAG: EamA family transporter [Gammaproteobacteria bacterium]|nr:EamA family transporter [Gammaproteobacteria bacterium]